MLLIIPYILSLGLSDVKLDNTLEHKEELQPAQRRLLYILLGLIITLLVNSKIEPYYSGLGLNETAILLSFDF